MLASFIKDARTEWGKSYLCHRLRGFGNKTIAQCMKMPPPSY